MKITNASRSFAETTTFHGLSELFLTTNKFMRALWSIIMLVSIGLCSWQLYQTITEFRSRPTGMRSFVKPLDEYPVIYFIVLNTIDYNKLQQYGLSSRHGWYILDHFPGADVEVREWQTMANASDQKDIEKIRADILRVQNETGWDFDELVRAVANSPESLFFVGPGVNSSVVINEWGINYAFATGMEINELQGYTVIVSTDGQNAISGQFNSDRKYLRAHRGIFFSVGSDIHNQAQWNLVKWKGYNWVVAPQVIRSISTKQRPCSNEYESTYQCRTICLAKNQACGKGCEWFMGQKGNHSQRFCINAIDRPREIRPCMNDCKALCPQSCNIWSYNVQSKLEDGYDSSNADVSIFISSMEVMVSEEYYTYSSNTLFSNIGGILSLYLGASVLSFLHLVYFWFFKVRIVTADPEKA